MSTGIVGLYSFELFLPESHSLKDKRMVLRSVKAQLHNRIACSIAEVDHHDVWQRTRLTLACVGRERRDVVGLIDDAERWLLGNGYEPLAVVRDVTTLDDR
jgi:uncharacterized protein YlxP (DUF503 family)